MELVDRLAREPNTAVISCSMDLNIYGEGGIVSGKQRLRSKLTMGTARSDMARVGPFEDIHQEGKEIYDRMRLILTPIYTERLQARSIGPSRRAGRLHSKQKAFPAETDTRSYTLSTPGRRRRQLCASKSGA